MSQSFIEELAIKRRQLLDSLEANEGDINLDIFEDFYPDKAHFVFELLQNAEDAGAKEVIFRLTTEGCWFEHDGKRAFTEADVKAITGIHNSTKSKTADQIGKFGVGFKSVFVYTLTPFVWSGDFSFKILQLIMPEHVARDPQITTKTRFYFPFNNPDKKPKDAYDEIDSGLKDLAETTLLFLSHLESIVWQNATGEVGEVLRVKHSENHFEVLKQLGSKASASSHFLKFDKAVAVAGLETQRVTLAYDLNFLPNVQFFDPKKVLSEQLKIIPATPGKVAVFFPAEKETSGLRFHLHAPFVPELSRASIKETEVNLPLFQQLATLAADTLHQIRDLGLLTVEFLSVLPNPQDSLPTRYQAIRNAITVEMNEQPLTPTYEKSHAPAKHLLQAKASLKELLSKDDITFLLEDVDATRQWASARALQGTNIERFMAGLAIADWDIEQFSDLLYEKASVSGRRIPYHPWYTSEQDADFMTWLSEKPANWHQEMYALLGDYLQSTLWQKDSYRDKLKSLRIIRLSNDEYSLGSKSYFQTDVDEQDDDLPSVDVRTFTSGRKKVQQESAKKFLEEMGVREVGEAEQVEEILKQRYTQSNLKPQKKDLSRFIKLLEKEPDKKNLFAPFFIFELPNGKWSRPSRFFLDTPFMDTGLSNYYGALGADAMRVPLAESYQNYGISIKKLAKFAEGVGTQTKLTVTVTNCHKNPQWRHLNSVGGNRTSTSIDRDYVIEGLDKVLAVPTLRISKLIWECMCSLPLYPDPFKAIYQKNQSVGSHQSDSSLVYQLSAAAWVPQGDELFVRPAEAVSELLPEGFPFDSGWRWLKAIQFGTEALKKSEIYRQKQTAAVELGFNSAEEVDKWKKLRDFGISPDEIIAQYSKRQLIAQPEDSVQNPIRRQEKVLANTVDAPSRESITLERSIQKDITEVTAQAKAYLRTKYKNSDGQLVCQCCQNEMPFKLSSGVHYFEAVQCVRDKETRYFQNRIALCPNCSAMYQYACETDEVEIRRCIVEYEADGHESAAEIPIKLAGRNLTIRFVSTHWFDLKAILSQ